MRVKCEPGAAPSRDPPSWSKNTRIQISVLIARQKICDGSTSPAQNRSNVSASAAASQYGRSQNCGERNRPCTTARRARSQRVSGVVNPTFQRRVRTFSVSTPRRPSRRMARLQPWSTSADDGRRNTQSTSSWSRNGRRDSIENAIELRSS